MTKIARSRASAVAGLLLATTAIPALAEDGSAQEWKLSADIYLYATPLSIQLPDNGPNSRHQLEVLMQASTAVYFPAGCQISDPRR